MYRRLIIGGLLSLFCGVSALSQPLEEDSLSLPREDVLASRYTQQGIYFLEIGNLPVAQDAFSRAANRPPHAETTLALYLAGLSYFKGGIDDSAAWYFRRLLSEYPFSGYLADTKYHLGLIWLRSGNPQLQERGVVGLFSLMDTADHVLQADIRGQVLTFLFGTENLELLERLQARLPVTYQMWTIEPLCYRYVQLGQPQQAQKTYDRFRKEQAFFSPFIEQMLEGPLITRPYNPDVAKIAVVLPLSLDPFYPDTPQTVPASKKIPLEYLEGIELGIQTYAEKADKQFQVQVFDSRRDSLSLALLLPILTDFQPDLVVGDIYNRQSSQLAEWADAYQIPQLVPLSPKADLTVDRPQTLLIHPPAYLHGVEMAKYARQVLGMERVAVWDDGQAGSHSLAYSFQMHFEMMGGEVIYVAIDSAFDAKSRKEIVRLSKVLANRPLDGMYIPIQGNEEAAGLILAQMRVLKPGLPLLGGPHFGRKYKTINSDLKTDLGLYYSTNYFTEANSPEFQHVQQAYLEQYGFPPSPYVIQGYDMGVYIATQLDQFDYAQGQSLVAHLRRGGRSDGLHLDIDFRGHPINQAVNVIQFTPEGKICVNCYPNLHLQTILTQVQD